MSYQFLQAIDMMPPHEEFEERKIPQKPALSRSWRMGWWMAKVVSICGPAPFHAIQVSFDNYFGDNDSDNNGDSLWQSR